MIKPGNYIATYVDDKGQEFTLRHHIIIDDAGNIFETHYDDTDYPQAPPVRFHPPREWSELFLGCYKVTESYHGM